VHGKLLDKHIAPKAKEWKKMLEDNETLDQVAFTEARLQTPVLLRRDVGRGTLALDELPDAT